MNKLKISMSCARPPKSATVMKLRSAKNLILPLILLLTYTICDAKIANRQDGGKPQLRWKRESPSRPTNGGSAADETSETMKRQIFPGAVFSPPCGPGGCLAPGGPFVGCAPPAFALPPPPPPPVPAPAFAPPPPPPVPAGRLIPQALPGAPCEPGVECTGGSVCSMGICLCPPELVQEGTVCVSRTIYGVVPPGPPPIPLGQPPVGPAFAPPMPVPAPIPAYYPSPGPIGAGPGTFCAPGYGASCVKKRQQQQPNGGYQDDVPDSMEQSDS